MDFYLTVMDCFALPIFPQQIMSGRFSPQKLTQRLLQARLAFILPIFLVTVNCEMSEDEIEARRCA
jgi:hypothetical protein